MTRKEACYFLGIREDADEEQIKKAYRYKAKLYHPDANPNTDTKEYYIKVQKAYEYLMSNPGDIAPSGMTVNAAAASVYNSPFGNAGGYMYGSPFAANFAGANTANGAGARCASARPAKVYASTATAKASYKEYTDKMTGTSRSKEDEILEKIRAIWLAETIRRQIELDKEHKEVLQRRKLYQAFMQQQVQDESAGNGSRRTKETD